MSDGREWYRLPCRWARMEDGEYVNYPVLDDGYTAPILLSPREVARVPGAVPSGESEAVAAARTVHDDVAEKTVPQMRTWLAEIRDPAEVEAIDSVERHGKDRKGVREAAHARLVELLGEKE